MSATETPALIGVFDCPANRTVAIPTTTGIEKQSCSENLCESLLKAFIGEYLDGHVVRCRVNVQQNPYCLTSLLFAGTGAVIDNSSKSSATRWVLWRATLSS